MGTELITAPAPFPVVEVCHLPSAASFYAAITQPLGLQYLSYSASPSPTCLHFGHIDPTTNSPTTIFALKQASPCTPPQQSLITLSAPSPTAVETFYKKALLANNSQKDHLIEKSTDEEAKARIEDLDGNMLEAVYSSRAGRRIPTIETASTEKEARRVLAWQHEVARSTAASDVHSSVTGSDIYGDRPPTYRRAETFPRMEAERPMRMVRRETVTTENYRDERDRAAIEGRREGNGFTESPPRLAPPLRRASYGDHGSHYAHTRSVETVRAVERFPARSYVSTRDHPPPKYVEYKVTPPPAQSQLMAHDMAMIEERSHASHRSARNSERGSRARSRSEVGSTRYDRPLTILPPRARSPGTHVSHRSHKSHHSKRDSDRDSYASARSHRTENTVKPVQHVTAPPSKAPTTTIRVMPKDERRSEVSHARKIPLPRSEVSARHIPLPPSMVSGREYAESVAPSDSVSSIGSKRERERLRERMSERGRW